MTTPASKHTCTLTESNRSTSNDTQTKRRLTSNDTQRKRLKTLDSFDLDIDGVAEHLAGTIQSGIGQYWPSVGDFSSLCERLGGGRVTSSDRVRDYIEDVGGNSPIPDDSPPCTAGISSSSGFLKYYFEQGATNSMIPKRYVTPRCTSSDWVKDVIKEGTVLEEGEGFGQQRPNREETNAVLDPFIVSDNDQDEIDQTTLDILRGLEVRSTKYTPFDVLFGRGGLSNHHVGNKRYRSEADKLKPEYRDKKTTKAQKTQIRNKLVDIVRAYGGRFLLYDKANETWIEAPLKQARRKASQALREDFKKVD